MEWELLFLTFPISINDDIVCGAIDATLCLRQRLHFVSLSASGTNEWLDCYRISASQSSNILWTRFPSLLTTISPPTNTTTYTPTDTPKRKKNIK